MHNHLWGILEEADESRLEVCVECAARRRVRRIITEVLVDQIECLDQEDEEA